MKSNKDKILDFMTFILALFCSVAMLILMIGCILNQVNKLFLIIN